MVVTTAALVIDRKDREFAFTVQDFERIRDLIYRHAGISLTPIKQDMVYSRLARRLRAIGCATFDQYLNCVESGDDAENQAFINALTTNLTSFFREPHHFEILRDFLRKQDRAQPVRIWCSAASTGEEVYSLAITACEAYDSMTPPVSIVATDIDTNVLEVGRKGVYPIDHVEKMTADRLRRFFLKGSGEENGFARVRPELIGLVQFSQVNLFDRALRITGPFDAIFCRNVMIYFDKPTQRAILEKFSPLLSKNGLLFAGHSESFLHSADLFRSLGKTVYERAIK